MAYRIMQRISSCRAPPGGAQDVLPRKPKLHRENGGFSGAVIVSMGKHDRPATGEKGRARQITNGVGSDDTAVIPRDIIHFFKEATIWQEKKAPSGAKCVFG